MLITFDIQNLIDAAFAEDLIVGDPTTDVLIPPGLTGQAALVTRDAGVLAGVDVATAVFQRFDPSLSAESLMPDGSSVSPGDSLARVSGSVASMLKAERTAVNFLQHLSGIASETRRYVDAVTGLHAKIVDTRKTTPGLRKLEKYAVRMGGGQNHRQNLADGILIKDNHIQAMALQGLGIGDVVKRANARASHTIKVEIEVDTIAQLEEVLDAGADLVLLDNMSTEQMRKAVEITGGRAVLEASGGINLKNISTYGKTGVDIISVGSITNSVKGIDMSLEI